LLTEAGTYGTPIVLLHSTGPAGADPTLAPVAKSLMEKRVQVDMQEHGLADRRRAALEKGAAVAGRLECVPDLMGVRRTFLSLSAGVPQLKLRQGVVRLALRRGNRKLRDQFARETDPAKQKAIAEAVQAAWTKIRPHVFLGQWYHRQPCAEHRRVRDCAGDRFWKVTKTGK